MIDKWYEKALVIVAVMLLSIIIGCAAFQNAVTPSWIERPALRYIEDMNTACSIPRFWWTSVTDAEVVDRLLEYSHDHRQLLLQRAKDDDVAWFAVIKGQHNVNLQNAYALRTQLFTPEGTIGLLATTGMGVMLGAIGFSKPGDKRQIEQLKVANGNSQQS